MSAGFVFAEFKVVLFDSELAGHTSLLADGKKLKQAEQAWQYVQEWWEPPRDRDGVRELLRALHAELQQHRWKGRAGNTDRLVSTTIVDHCHEVGTYTPVLSARFLAERASVGAATISRSLKRLHAMRLVTYRGKTRERNSQYRVNLRWQSPAKGHNGTSNSLRSTCSSLSLTYESAVPQHDLFVSKALGHQAGRLYFTMTDSLTAKEVSEAFGYSEKSSRRYLESLVNVGLAVKSEGRPSRYTIADVPLQRLDELADEYGTLGWHIDQAAKHENSRCAYELDRQLRDRDYLPGVFMRDTGDK